MAKSVGRSFKKADISAKNEKNNKEEKADNSAKEQK